LIKYRPAVDTTAPRPVEDNAVVQDEDKTIATRTRATEVVPRASSVEKPGTSLVTVERRRRYKRTREMLYVRREVEGTTPRRDNNCKNNSNGADRFSTWLLPRRTRTPELPMNVSV
jgi:hypothetical protein